MVLFHREKIVKQLDPFIDLSPSLIFKCGFYLQQSEARISTILIRGSTDNFMDDIERAVESGINTYKALTKVRTYILKWIFESDFMV